MISLRPSRTLKRRLLRALALLAGLAVLLGASVVALLSFWLLPNLPQYRDDVAAALSRAMGQTVTLDAVAADWQTLRPSVHLTGVRLRDADGHTALHLPQLDGAFSWRSLLWLEPRFSTLSLRGLHLQVRRSVDGHWFLGGVRINPAAPEPGFAQWLLRQGRIRVSDARVDWLDAQRAAPALALTDFNLDLDRRFREHRLQATFSPPPELARPVRLTLRFAGPLDTPARWHGQFHGSVAGVRFARLAPWLDAAIVPAAGWAALTLEGAFADARLTRVTTAFTARDLSLARLTAPDSGRRLAALTLGHAAGRVAWTQQDGTQRVDIHELRLDQAPPFDLTYRWGATLQQLQARALNLAVLARHGPALPLPGAWHEALRAHAPRGRIDTLYVDWRRRAATGSATGAAIGPATLTRIKARVSGIALAATGPYPGIDSVSGELDGNAAAGRFDFSARRTTLDLPTVFREPRLPLDTLTLRGRWSARGTGHRLQLDTVRFANADLAGSVDGQIDLRPGHAPVADLKGALNRADGTRVYRYLPRQVGDLTVDWVREAIKAGGSRDVKFKLRGDLARFPFSDGSGDFSVDSQLTGGIVEFAPGWPRIEGIAARMLFERDHMILTARQARIQGVALQPVSARIPNLIHHDEHLLIDGIATGPATDFVRFANTSALAARLRHTTRGLAASGGMQLALRLDIPLRNSLDTTLQGELRFLGGSLKPAQLPVIRQLTGTLAFSEKGLSARALHATFLGGPLQLAARTDADTVHLDASGRASASALAPYLPAAIATALGGQTPWRGTLALEPAGERIRIESTLDGLDSTLPAPLDKPARVALPFVFEQQTDGSGTAQFGPRLGVAWQRQAGTIERLRIELGGRARTPDQPGLQLAGAARGLDVAAWQRLLRALPASSPPAPAALPALASVDLDLSDLRLLGRRFAELRLHGEQRDGVLRLRVQGPETDGTLQWRAATDSAKTGGGQLSARFARLALPPTELPTEPPGEPPTNPPTDPPTKPPAAASSPTPTDPTAPAASAYPLIDLQVADFKLAGRALGRLEASARGTAQGLRIDNLTLTHPDSQFRMAGLWRDAANGLTRADVALDLVDAGSFLDRFGFPDAVARGTATVKGEVEWPGSPADFALTGLSGTLRFKAAKGQFLKVEPGAGKLLGIVSLQALPRRLSFDFRDLFSDGYAFDSISATMRITRGVVYSDDFRMNGVAARVEMSGLAALEAETVQLRVKIAPRLSDSVTLAGALIGGPIAGVGAFAAQKLLRDPLEAFASRELLISGSWQDPTVKKLSRAAAAPAAP